MVQEVFGRHFKVRLKYVNASAEFLKKLKGVTDPERKRKIIGRTFIDVFQRAATKIGKAKFLAQGTLYPDVIESVPIAGNPAALIKSHHNVGGLPKKMKLKLVEPLKCLFKDEVRRLGEVLGLTEQIVWRHPFPGPGLAVRITGDITRERLDLLRDADEIVLEEIVANNLYRSTSQVFAVLLAGSLTQGAPLHDWIQVLAGLAALAGHIWPVWLGFKGGKAVATGLGLFLGLAWPVGLACFGIFLTTLSVFRIVSLSSVMAAISLPLLMAAGTDGTAKLVVALVAMALVVWRHRSNLQRIKAGTEPRLGQKA